jgi:hypothetical protein
VTPDEALLFLTLAAEGQVPDYFRTGPQRRISRFLQQLVLDRILEVEHNGIFVSGPEAIAAIGEMEEISTRGRIAELSMEALRYADALCELSVPELARSLYEFGRLPITRGLKRAFDRKESNPSTETTEAARGALNAYWLRSPVVDPFWTMWRLRNAEDGRAMTSYKLYVSPGLENVPAAFAAAAESLGRCPGVSGLKLGRGVLGLTRPDKIVAYFPRLEDLQEAGHRLHQRLQGCSVHGVPFTAALSADGLLSWGAVRPRTTSMSAGSWRLWLARRLATYLKEARASKSTVAGWRFALERLRMDGVDPSTWTPCEEFWSEPRILP